jgi:hypothetical protein
MIPGVRRRNLGLGQNTHGTKQAQSRQTVSEIPEKHCSFTPLQ